MISDFSCNLSENNLGKRREKVKILIKLPPTHFFCIITLKSIEWKMYKRCQFGFHIKDKRQVRQNQK